MAIYEPQLFLTAKDRELLLLLAQLVGADQPQGNADPSTIPLSPSEGERLLKLLEQFSQSRVFVEGSYFSEGMANGEAWSDDSLREIYLSWRKRRGRSRAMASRHWNEMVLRLGFGFSDKAKMYSGGIASGPVVPMPFEHFARMERRLLRSTNLHPRVASLAARLVSQAESEIEALRAGTSKVKRGAINRAIRQFITQVGEALDGLEKRPVSKFQIVATTVIVADTAAYFTTRDWTATGVLSNLAAVTTNALDS